MAAEQLAAGRTRLPPGRHGLSSDFVAENQRERLLNGLVEAVAADGYNATTIGRIAEASKISRRTFYRLYTGKEDVAVALYRIGTEGLLAVLETMRPADVAGTLTALPEKRRHEVVDALDDERLADVFE